MSANAFFSKCRNVLLLVVIFSFAASLPAQELVPGKVAEITFPKETLPKTLYSIVSGEDVCLSHRYSLPNKLFHYIGAGLPVICSDLMEMKKFVEENKVGISVESNDVKGFIKAFRNLPDLDSPVLKENILPKQTLSKQSFLAFMRDLVSSL